LEPVRIPAGAAAQVRMRLQNVSRLPTGIMLAEDAVPYLLGGRPRFVLDRLLPQRAVEVDYQVRSSLRGRYRIGPLSVRLTDPFGLCELVRGFSASDVLVVTPPVVALPPVRLGGDWAGSGEQRARSIATSGEDDAATREYRQGDDLRRIHWRSTARRGELMVRREEQPWQSRGVLLLDCRDRVHRGDGPHSSLEWAVSAAASIGVHLARGGYAMRLVTESIDEITADSLGAQSFESVLLDVLAVQSPSSADSLQPGVASMRHGGGEELYIAIVGPMSTDDAHLLARLPRGGATVAVAFVLHTASWTALPPAATKAATKQHDDTCRTLSDAGWRVLSVQRGSLLADLWASAAGRGSPETGVVAGAAS
jgi:uncharacterized protein (DUF58 family)